MPRWIALLMSVAFCSASLAQSVEFRLNDRAGWVGSPLIMEVEVNGAGNEGAPTVAASEDFESKIDPTPRRMEWRQSINGRATSRSTLTYRGEFIPKRDGPLQIPIVELKGGGKTWRSTAEIVTIAKSTASESLRLEIQTVPPSPWVGQSVELTLRILVRPFTSAQHGVTLDEGQMWRLIDEAACTWGVLEARRRELMQTNRRPVGHEEIIDGQKWLVFELGKPFIPTAPGPMDLGDLRVAWNYPTGITVGRDFFGSPELSLSGVRTVTASIPSVRVKARALPDAGKPASFRGAVGEFEVRTSARPSEVAVGDPITLSVAIVDLSKGGNELTTLQPPPIDQASLGGAFRVPTDPLAGTVDGSVKSFTQTIRPTSADLKQIPPIEFSYFDPTKGAYATARSQPIPIRVSPSELLAGHQIERSVSSAVAGNNSATTLTEVEGGLVANAAPTEELLEDQRLVFGAGTVALFALPPLCALAALLLRSHRDRRGSDMGRERVRLSTRKAAAAIAAAPDVAGINAALYTFVADRTSHAIGTITRSQAVHLAQQAGADATLCDALLHFLAQGERAVFAPLHNQANSSLQLEAQALLVQLDRLQWKRRVADVLEEDAA